MRTIKRTFANLSKSTLFLGRAGENLVTRLEINISKELNEFSDPVFELVLKMPAYADPYPVLVTVQDNVLTYTFSGYDLSQNGNGELELLVCGQDGEVLKSTTAKTRIEQSIIPNAYPGPLQKVIDDLKAAIGEIEAKSGIKVVDELPETPDVDAVVYLDGVGIYHYTGTEWEQLSDNGEGQKELEESINAIRDDLPSAAEIERWNAAAGAKHSHENKPSLDKLLVSETFVGLPDGAETGSVGIVTGIDTASKSIAQYDAATDAQTPVTIASSLVYNAAAQMDDAVMVIDTENDDVDIALLPVYTPDVSDPASGGAGMILVTEQTNPKKYMVIVGPDVSLARADLIADFNIDDPDADVLFVYAFETVTGDLKAAEEENEDEYETIAENVQIAQGWNAVFLTENGVFISALADPNAYCDLGEFGSIDTDAPQHPYLYDVLRLVTTEDKRGIYHKTGGEWVRYYSGDLQALADRVSVLENGEPDDVTLLGFETYSGLVVRDEAVDDESIQDVPVYVPGGAGLICALYTYTDDPQSEAGYDDGIELVELRQNDTGMPLRVIAVMVGGVRYTYYPQDYRSASGVTLVSAGWNMNDQPTDAPTISGFTPDRCFADGTMYADLANLSDAAKSALRSLSQCIHVSAAAMGTIRVPDDAVLRFNGEFQPNGKYHFETGDDCTFDLPVVPWSDKDALFAVYLTCTVDVDITFPATVQFAGGAPNSETGAHKVIGSYLRGVGVWAIGGMDYEVPA